MASLGSLGVGVGRKAEHYLRVGMEMAITLSLPRSWDLSLQRLQGAKGSWGVPWASRGRRGLGLVSVRGSDGLSCPDQKFPVAESVKRLT